MTFAGPGRDGPPGSPVACLPSGEVPTGSAVGSPGIRIAGLRPAGAGVAAHGFGVLSGLPVA